MESVITYYPQPINDDQPKRKMEEYTLDENKLIHGIYKSWYPNGKLFTSYSYFHGKYEGSNLSWSNDGKKMTECQFKMGKLHGSCLFYQNNIKYVTCEYANGIIQKLIEWYNNGNVLFEEKFDNGKKVNCQEFYETGIQARHSEYDPRHSKVVLDIKYTEKGIKISELKYTYAMQKDWYVLDETDETYWNDDGSIKSHRIMKEKDWKNVTCDSQGRSVILPPGEITGWKACKNDEGKFVYVNLLIPAEADRICAFSEEDAKANFFKCRASYAIVKRIVDKEGKEYKKATSFVFGSNKSEYIVDEKVIPDGFEKSKDITCGPGVNFHRFQDECDYWKNQ
ncbi:MAG: pentapeptide repeat-containing protein [Edafosvirus sp.]|uniref:Pentapeptide repeat-containing protein n=1 Tax=Edafosvirus sp. TaxID=2487765 RepID=A0A3G4ZS89_9VIRU|nr:MAG: pentapeptide repeat-containing protein [Edafosvirus sp.]